MKHVWGLILTYLRTRQGPFKTLAWDRVERYKIALIRRLKRDDSLLSTGSRPGKLLHPLHMAATLLKLSYWNTLKIQTTFTL
jgi:hypothetical protein